MRDETMRDETLQRETREAFFRLVSEMGPWGIKDVEKANTEDAGARASSPTWATDSPESLAPSDLLYRFIFEATTIATWSIPTHPARRDKRLAADCSRVIAHASDTLAACVVEATRVHASGVVLTLHRIADATAWALPAGIENEAGRGALSDAITEGWPQLRSEAWRLAGVARSRVRGGAARRNNAKCYAVADFIQKHGRGKKVSQVAAALRARGIDRKASAQGVRAILSRWRKRADMMALFGEPPTSLRDADGVFVLS